MLERLECKAALTTDEAGLIEGKAWDFATPDRVGDVIEPAAFASAVGKTLPMLFGHDRPVGVWSNIAVDGEGLKVKGRLLVEDVPEAKSARALVRAGGVTGLSVGFVTKKSAPRKAGGRTISDLDLVEVSIVAVPAHAAARITSAKDLLMTDTTIEKPEAKPEAKAAPAVDTKAIDAITARLDAMETKLARPAIVTGKKVEEDVEAKALNSWLRTGEVDAEVKTLVAGTPSAGGYVTAPEYSTNVIKKVTELSPMRRLASVMTIGAGEVYIPTLVDDAEGGWVTETGDRTEDEPEFGQVNIKAFEHAVIIPVSRQLLEDSTIDLSGFLAERIAIKFAQAEGTAFTSGNGIGKPTGFLNTPASFEQVTADQDSSDIIEKMIDLFYSLPSEYAARATWAMNRRTMGIIRKAADTTTKGTLWSDSLANGQPARFLGVPVAEFNEMDDVASGDSPAGDTYPVALADFGSLYQVVDRVGLQVMRDDYTGASKGIVKFHARRRVGGKVVLPEAGVLLKAAA